MSKVRIPPADWNDFLESFSQRHSGWPVSVETHDLETGETVTSRPMPLSSLILDLEDEKNPRINLTFRIEGKEIRHILFRPSKVELQLSGAGADAAIEIEALNTRSTVRFQNAGSAWINEVA